MVEQDCPEEGLMQALALRLRQGWLDISLSLVFTATIVIGFVALGLVALAGLLSALVRHAPDGR
jgi:hypothetical protein